MKTRTENRRMDCKEVLFAMIVTLMLLTGAVSAQYAEETRTLLRSDIKVTEMWTPEIKLNSIQGQIGTLVGFYGGALFNRNLLLGISG